MEWATVREAVLDALAVVAPVACAGCDAEDRAVCTGCRSHLTPTVERYRIAGDIEVSSALRYEDRVRRVILALKEQGRTDTTPFLAPAMRRAIAQAVRGEVELTTVPTSAEAFRRRGYDPVRSLLRASRLPSRVVLSRVRSTQRQKTLDVRERSVNLVGSMRARRRLDGRRFVVVDDVMTTGSTLVEAARAIREAGGEVVSCATLAFTPRWSAASLGTAGMPRESP